MKCLTCKTEMVGIDDVNDVSARIDWEECPKCHSGAEILYGNHGEYIEKVLWTRNATWGDKYKKRVEEKMNGSNIP